jgi:hypothetical protein
MNAHNLFDTPAEKEIDKLRVLAKEESDKYKNQAQQAADRRKAQLDRAAEARALAVLDEARAIYTAAGEAAFSYQSLVDFYTDAVMSATTDADRNAAEEEITKNAALVITETAKEAKAKKIVTRLTEAYNNNKTLANLAEELANAKANTDEIIAGLVLAGTDLQAEVEARELSRAEARASIEQNEYALQGTDPTDKTAVAKINAAIDSLNTLIQGKDESDNNAARLQKEYSFQQIQVFNQYRITQAKLQAEIVNAEFSVNLKEKLNIKDDIEEIDAEVGELNTAME